MVEHIIGYSYIVMEMEQKVKPKRAYRSPKRTQQTQETRRRILDAARRLFRERGYAATALREIALSAEVSVETVYAVFGSKRELLLQIVATAQPPAGGAALDLTHLPAPAQVAALAGIARQIYDQYWDIIDVLRGAGYADPDIAVAWQAGDRQGRAVQAPVVAAWAARGILTPGVTQEAAADIVWALTGPDLYRLLVHESGWSPEAYQAWLAGSLSGLLLGPI